MLDEGLVLWAEPFPEPNTAQILHTEHRVENTALRTPSSCLGKNLGVSHHRLAFTNVMILVCSVSLLML